MTLSFTNATGNLFNRLGVMLAGIRDANTYLAATTDISAGGLRTVGVRATNIDAQFASTNQDVVSGGAVAGGLSLYGQRDTVRGQLDSWKSYLAALVNTTVIEMAHADATLVTKDVPTAWKEVIRQMAGAGTIYAPDFYVDANVVSVTVSTTGTGVTNTGNGALVCSVKRTDARDNEMIFVEAIEFTCDSDSGSGGTAGGESWSYRGENPAASEMDWNAGDTGSKGSGCSGSLTSIDPALDAQASGNVLTNSDWETWTTATNPPDNWLATTSSPAFNTDLLKNTSVVFAGSNALEMKGLASGKGVKILFNNSSGTNITLKPNTRYALSYWAKKSAGLAAGAIRLDVVNASETQTTNDAGSALEYIVAAGTLTTTYANYSTTFVTPRVMPSSYYLRVSASTTLTAAESIYMDQLAMAEMTELYAGGPTAAVFTGSTNWAKGDKFFATTANNFAGDFQTYINKASGLRALGLQLPSTAGGTNIADSLIT